MKMYALRLLPVFILFPFFSSFGQCTATGYSSGSVSVNDADVGSFGWNSLSNILSSDNDRAVASITLGAFSTINSNYLIVEDFGFNIPIYASICGIEATVERKAGGLGVGASVKDNEVRLVKDGAIVGDNEANSSKWPSSDGTAVYGSSTPTSGLWGTTWGPADINDSHFGIAISTRLSTGLIGLFLSGEVDQVTIRVSYITIALPIRLLDFTVKEERGNAQLNWTTASSSNNTYFIVERSANGTDHWKALDSMVTPDKSNTSASYGFTDRAPMTVNYYRLRQRTSDDSVALSQVLRLTMKEQGSSIRVFPNPANSYFHIRAGAAIDQLSLLDASGRTIPVHFAAEPGGWKVDLPASCEGVYFLRIATREKTVIKQVYITTR